MKLLHTPILEEDISTLRIGEPILISGRIYCGRDAVLPKICKLIEEERLEEYGIDLQGGILFHTAVSVAGVGPTSSNKPEIEGSFRALSKQGIKLQLGKGKISKASIKLLDTYHSAYAVIPPVTALLTQKIISKTAIAFPELGMEAFYELEVADYPAIIAAVHNDSIY